MNLKKWALNTIFIFLLELIFHISLFSSISIYLIFTLLFSTIISFFITLISNIDKKGIINIILNITITVLFFAQLVHFKFYHSIISIYSMVNGSQVFDFFSAILKVILNNLPNLLLLFVPLIIFIFFSRKIKSEKVNYKKLGFQAVSVIVIFVITALLLSLDNAEIYNAKDLYTKVHTPTFMVKKLGLLTTMRLDLQRNLSSFGEDLSLTINTEDNQNMYNSNPNTLEIDFDVLIRNEKDDDIKTLHKYFKQSQPTEKNTYTGMFKDKNLIILVAESFSPIAIDKNLTPTLYKLYNEGFKFNNFYSPIFYVSTSDGEYITSTSLLPKEGSWSFQESANMTFPFTYGNIFQKQGYITNAYHNGKYDFYRRNLSHPNMGYNFQACGNGLEKKINCDLWPQSDLEMVNSTVTDYINNEKFLTYYMTVSGHLNYNFKDNSMAIKNKSKVDNLPYSEEMKAYLATNIELDKAVNSLIEKLKLVNKLDDTVILITSDHFPYGLSLTEMEEKATYITNEKFDIHKNNLIIWNSTLEAPIEVNKYSSNLDILPTVLNLFGIKYDSRLLMGKDILSTSEGIVIFNDRSWITEYGRYNASNGKFTSFKNLKDREKYISTINRIVYNKFSISRAIFETNYYKYLNVR